MKRITTVGAATAALAIALMAFAAAPAQAHDVLASSTPTAGSTITELPDVFSVTMNEEVLNLAGDGSGFALQITDAAGLYFGDGCLSVSGATLSMGPALGSAGTYTVLWQVVSGDGHPTDGEYTFTWAGTDASPGSVTAPVCGVASEEPTPTPDNTLVGVQPVSESTGPNGILVGGGILAALAVIAAAVAVIFAARRKAPGEE